MIDVTVKYRGSDEEPFEFKDIEQNWKVDLNDCSAFEASMVNVGFVFKIDNPEDEPENWKISLKDPEKLCVNTPLNPDYALFTWEAAKRVFLIVVRVCGEKEICSAAAKCRVNSLLRHRYRGKLHRQGNLTHH